MQYQKFVPEGWNKINNNNMNDISNALKNGKIIEGLVNKCDSNYNLYVNLGNDITGVIPRTEIEAINTEKTGYPKPNICMNKVNKVVQVKIKKIENEKIILSRKEVGTEAINWIKNELHEGTIVYGIVKNIRPYGVFVEIGGGIVGLLHIEDISVARIKTPLERFEVGQKINIMIKYIDKELNRVILTYKELLGTWEENVKYFEEGSTVIGIARETEKFKNGIFIELKPNLVGMADYKENIEYGQKVRVYIKKIIPEKRKIKLNLI